MYKEISKVNRLFFNSPIFTTVHIRLQKTGLHFILCFLFSIGKIYSQKTELPFKVALSAGASFPVGKFSDTAPDSSFTQKQSAAKPGPLVTLSLSYTFKHSPYGVELLGGWQQNNVNDLAIARSLAGYLPPGSEIAVGSDNWHIWKILAGPTIQIPLTQKGKTSLAFGVLGGILKTTVPGYESSTYYGNPPIATFESFSKIPLPAAFCYQLNAGVNYPVSKAFLLTANLNFMHAAPVHSYTYYLDPPYFTMPVHASQSYPISTLNLLVGIAYVF
jgi:hypothetical protein